jgi:hypothetical protein
MEGSYRLLVMALMNVSRLSLSFEKTEKALAALKLIVEKPMQSDRSNIDAWSQPRSSCL